MTGEQANEAGKTLTWRQVRAGLLDVDIEKLRREVVADMAQEKEADRTREDWRALFIKSKQEYEFDNAMVSDSTSDDKASESPEASEAEEVRGSSFEDDQVVKVAGSRHGPRHSTGEAHGPCHKQRRRGHTTVQEKKMWQ